MFDVFTSLKCVSQRAGRSAWLWSVEFRVVEGTHFELSHMSEGICNTLESATMEMVAAAAKGTEQLRACGFQIKDTSALAGVLVP